MPLLKTRNPFLQEGVDAYILIHESDSRNDFDDWQLLHRADPRLEEASCNAEAEPYADPIIMPGFNLDAKFVIHILQPLGNTKKPGTREQYRKALLLAQAHHCESVKFIMPQNVAEAEKINAVCRSFVQESDMLIYLGGPDVGISGSLLSRLIRYLRGDYEREECLASFVRPDEDLGIREDRSRFPQALPQSQELHKKGTEAPRPKDSCPQASKPKAQSGFHSIQEFLKRNDAGFKDTLLKYIDRTGKKDSEIYKKANVDRRLFSKIINVQGYNPSKPTAIAFAIALELNLEETKDLIGRAGYTLSHASTFDRIIEFFILEGNYDIYEINEALFYFDQSLLGC